jgi:hypothetical protein
MFDSGENSPECFHCGDAVCGGKERGCDDYWLYQLINRWNIFKSRVWLFLKKRGM